MDQKEFDTALRRVKSYSTAQGADAEAIARLMVKEGWCVWHACSQYWGTACYCHDCRPDVRRLA
jgi:hypothetical protein